MTKKKVSTTPLKQVSFADQFGGGPALPENDTDLQASTEKKGPSVEELLARIDQMGKRVEDLSRANTVLSTPLVTVAPTTPKAPVLDMSGLPDPTFDRDGYDKAVAQRVEAYTDAKFAFREQATQTATREKQTREQQVQGLWQDFRIAHADHAGNEDLAGYAAKVVMDRAKERGIDADRYMFANRAQFMEDVVKEIEKIAAPRAREDKEDEVDLSAEPATRTGGLFSNPASTPPARGTKAEAGDMIKDLQDMQRRNGFF